MIYSVSFTGITPQDTFKITISAGYLRLPCTFTWNTENQEQLDAFNQYIERLAKNDPLYKKGEPYDRNYNYLDWYLQFSTCNDFNDYKKVLEAQDYIPYSLTRYDLDSDLLYDSVIKPRVSFAKTFDEYRLLFKECGVWQCSINYEGDIRTARIVPGGWACKQDNIFSFRFTSDLETIGYDDFSKVTFEVNVK